MAKGQYRRKCSYDLPDYFVTLGFENPKTIASTIDTLKRSIGKKAVIYSANDWALPLFKISSVKEFRKQVSMLEPRARNSYIISLSKQLMTQKESFKFKIDDPSKPIKANLEGDLFIGVANDYSNGICEIDYAVNRAVAQIMNIFGTEINAEHRGYLVGKKTSALNEAVHNEIAVGCVNDGFLPWDSVEHRKFVEDPCEFIRESGHDPLEVFPEEISLGALNIVAIDRKNGTKLTNCSA